MSDVDEGNFYDRSPIGLTDAGAERDLREHPSPLCSLRAWCMLAAGHEGGCVEPQRPAYVRPAWDTATPDPSHWREFRPKPELVKRATPTPAPAPAPVTELAPATEPEPATKPAATPAAAPATDPKASE